MRFPKITDREWEDLSAYLDNQLTPKQSRKIELELETRPELREALQEIRRTQAVLRAQGIIRAPRNFTLTPEMIGIKEAASRMWRPSVRLVSALNFSSALAGALFLITIATHFLIGGRIIRTAKVAMAPAPHEIGVETTLAIQAEATQAVEAFEKPSYPAPLDTSQEAPPIVNKMLAPTPEAGYGSLGGQIVEPTGGPALAAASPITSSENVTSPLNITLPTPTTSAGVSANVVPAYPQPLRTEAVQPSPTAQYPGQEVAKVTPPRLGVDVWLWVEIGLGAVAIGTGVTALVMRRRRG